MKAEKTTEERTSRTIQQKSEQNGALEFVDNRTASPIQRIGEDDEETMQQKPNNTGMPDSLKAGVESLSGYSMDDVRVHYNSDKPAAVQAHAYTQGQDIHVAPGQEQHLPHEAWHVAQQMAGRVEPTTEIGGMPVNDSVGLEREADIMGDRANQF